MAESSLRRSKKACQGEHYRSVRKKEGKERGEWTERLTPNDSFLIQEIIDHLDAVPHLGLGLFRHGNDRTHNLARLDII